MARWIAGGLVAALLAACGGQPVVPPKVVVVGIDGAEWSVIDQLRAEGRLPTLGRLIESGAHGRLATVKPTLSPALWTTIATGEPATVHGIENFVVWRPHAELVLPWRGGGDVRLQVAIESGCPQDALQIAVDGAPVAPTWDGNGVRVRIPSAEGDGPAVVALDLAAGCAPAPEHGGGPPWGRLEGVTLLGPSGEVVAEAGPPELASAERGIGAPVERGGPALLVGRRVAQAESSDRRVPALWNIASAGGRSVAAIGWWCTWPAERVRGTMVSDFLFFASTRRLLDMAQLPAHALQAGAVYPPEAIGLLADALPETWQMTAEELARFVPETSPRFADHLAAPARLHALGDPPLVVLKDTYLINRPYFAAARRLATQGQPDLLLVYTNLVDAVEHKFWRDWEPARFPDVSAEELADFGDTIPRTYAYVDGELAAVLSALAPDSVVLVLSDHGHHAARAPGVFSGEHADAPPGILIAAGPGVRPGEIEGAGLYDIAPTVLALLGLPVARDMPGHVLGQLFASPPRVATVASYRDVPRAAAPAPAPAEIDPAVRERLRALGYLE